MHNYMKTLIVTVLGFCSLSIFGNDEITAKDIVKSSYMAFYYPGDDAQQKARMLIVDKKGSKQLRQFNIFKKDKEDGGDQDFLVVFEKPNDVKDMVFLVNKHTQKEDDKWLYLPGLDLEKRISSSDDRTSFVGSDYYYEDISGRDIDLDEYELMNEDQKYYWILAIPKDSSSVEFDQYEMKIDKNTMLPAVVSYSRSGKEIRRAEVLEVKEVDGFPTVMKSKISNLETGGYTLVQFKKPNFNIGLESKLFSQRSLRNPPKSLFKND